MRSGWMPPAEAMTRAVGMFAIFAAPDVKATPLWRPFEQFPREVPEASHGLVWEEPALFAETVADFVERHSR